MGTLLDCQNPKYRFVLDLIKNEETYDKKQKVISGMEACYLCHKRYEELQSILSPLKSLLGDNVFITSVNFTNNMQDEFGIAIKYLKDSNLCILIIRLCDLEVFDISLSDHELDSEEFLENNRDIINSVIEELARFEFIDNPEIQVKSSSKKFIIYDNINDFLIKSNEEKLFSVGTNHYIFDKDKKMFVPDHITCDDDVLKEELMNEETLQKIYNNIRVNEDDFPKKLIKKIN